MVRKLCTNFINFICEDNFNDDDKEIMEYVLKSITFEILKLIGSLIIFYFLGYLLEAIVITAAISFVKPFIGGYHATSQLSCFSSTVIINLAIIILSKNCTLNLTAMIILITFSFLAVYNQAPIINENMPLTKPELIMKNRKKGLISLSIISITTIVLYFFNTYFAVILCWTILSLAIFMFNRCSWTEKIN